MKRWSLALATLVLGAFAGSYFVGPLLHGQQAVVAPPALVKELTSYRDIVKRVLPAVVSIETRAKVARVKGKQPRPPMLFQGQVPEEFRKFFEQFDNVPFDQEFDMPPHTGFGSGFFISADGVILTNYHVVNGADQVAVTLTDGRKFTSKDIHGDRRTDLAIVRIHDGGNFSYLELGDSDAMDIGDRVLAVGAPFGLTGSVTHGIISAKGRNGLHMNMYEDFLQTDAAINPGNSGGPLVSLDGKVVGINAAIKTHSGGFQGVGLAVASNLARNVSKALLKDGVVRRGYLGVQIGELSPDVAKRFGLAKGTGVVVGQVFPDTPAAKAGLKDGDIVTEIAGKKVKDGRTLQHIVAGLPLKKPVDLSIVRDGNNMTLHVTIEEQPSEFGNARAPAPRPTPNRSKSESVDKLGIEIGDLDQDLAESLGFSSSTRGAVITGVDSGSVGFTAGLRRGMLVAKVDSHKVADAAAARQALEKASLPSGILLQVQTPRGGTNFIMIRKGAGE
jgi:serine protease Do